MSKEVKVKQGEHVAGIAKREGFTDYQSIWNFGPNSELKNSLHRSPTLLFPGDILSIPDFETKTLDRSVDKRHPFKRARFDLFLQVVGRDVNDKAFGTEAYTLTIASGKLERVADGNGMTSDRIAFDEEEANLKFAAKKVELRLRIGHLNPLVENPANAEQVAGWQVRLYNLGYFSGFAVDDAKQLKWAVEEFQRNNGWDPAKGKKPTGLMDAESRDKLESVYGC